MEVVKDRMLLPMRRANETINALGCSTLRHHQFFQASPMKLLPLIGALLISAVPVHAFETVEEVFEACEATEEIESICSGFGEIIGAAAWVSLLCDLEEKGRLTKENVVLTWDEFKKGFWKPLLNEVVEGNLERYPECSIKP